jgi:hypothetical protein
MDTPVIDRDAFNLFETPNLTGTPERRLLLAILERAILDYVGNDQREADQSSTWLFGDMTEEIIAGLVPGGEFSFPWLCDQLDLDFIKIAEKIRQMPKRGKSRLAPWHLNKVSQEQAAKAG